MKQAAQVLMEVINTFADRRTNPVLAILPANGIVELDRRYPGNILDFDDIGLRAYYHCHTASERPENEHGHFHLFVRIPGSWSHLAGLSMDNMGQPLQWFTVNHWVTGEQWCNAAQLATCLDFTRPIHNASLTEQWLYAMLNFYHAGIVRLLLERDRAIDACCMEWQRETVLQERSIYGLSKCKINLLQDLSSHMPSNISGRT